MSQVGKLELPEVDLMTSTVAFLGLIRPLFLYYQNEYQVLALIIFEKIRYCINC